MVVLKYKQVHLRQNKDSIFIFLIFFLLYNHQIEDWNEYTIKVFSNSVEEFILH